MSGLLWRERQLLELLLFKLEEEQLVLASDRRHLLTAATAEVSDVVEQLRACEAEREVEAAALAHELGIKSPPRLSDLVGALDDELWAPVFAEHREALTGSLQRVQEVRGATRPMLAARMAATADALTLLGDHPTEAYGREPAKRSGGHLVKGSM